MSNIEELTYLYKEHLPKKKKKILQLPMVKD